MRCARPEPRSKCSRVERGGDERGTPPTIQALLATRIDALSGSERDVLDRAAVEGRSFHRGAVAALLPETRQDELERALSTLEQRNLIRPGESELPDETGYRFAHVLVRDVAYELLPKSAPAALHEAFGNWLEERFGSAYAEVVAYHLESDVKTRFDDKLQLRSDGRHLEACGPLEWDASDVRRGTA